MKKTVYLALAVMAVPNAYAFDLVSLNASAVKRQEISVPAPVARKIASSARTAQTREHISLWMNVRDNIAYKELQAQDFMAQIEVWVHRTFDGQFTVDSKVDGNFEWAKIQKYFNRDYRMSGDGMFLSMNEWGGNYNISGNMTENGQVKYINLTMYRRFNDFSFSVNSYGLNLYIDKTSINGSFETTEYSKKSVAAIVALGLAVRAESKLLSSRPPGRKSARQVSGSVNLAGHGAARRRLYHR